MKRRIIGILLALVLLMSFCANAWAVTEQEISAVTAESAEYMLDCVKAPQVGTMGGEWAIIGLARSGYEVPQKYWDGYYAEAERYVKACGGVLHTKKYTEYARVVLALTAIGANPADVAGYNLLTPLGDFEKTVFQGVNGAIWALIALDSGDYQMPVNKNAKVQATRQMYIDEILGCQLQDGGWNLADRGGTGQADADVTAMALQALAKYRSQPAVKTATERALTCLSKMLRADGFDGAKAESVAQAVVALCELGIELDDSRFVKKGNTLLDILLTYRNKNGSFRHTADTAGSNQMASEQGLYALAAVQRVMRGENSLYRMGDCSIFPSTISTEGLPEKHPQVKKTEIVVPGKTFADIAAHENQAAIEALIARGIINGMADGTFAPDKPMTRAQFATIVVKSLGLTPKANGVFSDVYAKAWYAPYVGTAYTYGIVNGRSGTLFDPEGLITRQEAACMVARAANLCGMDTERENYEILNVLAQFADYITAAQWARESLTFCYDEDIMNQSDLHIEPNRAILRCEIAQMLYCMLSSAKLL